MTGDLAVTGDAGIAGSAAAGFDVGGFDGIKKLADVPGGIRA
jgi:hypothetical protein